MIDQLLRGDEPKVVTLIKLIYFLGLPGFMVLFFLAQSAGFIPSISQSNHRILLENQQYLRQSFLLQTEHNTATVTQTHIMRINCLNQATDVEARHRCMSNP